MHGSADRQGHAEAHSERLHAELPQSHLVLVQGEGHMLHHRVPNEVMAGIDMAAAGAPAKAPDPGRASVQGAATIGG
jgi:pimeloyl-ACP methyl ester carboxylesterase